MATKGKDNNFDWLVKLLIIGDSQVGKTNILLRFCEDNFQATHLTTIGIDFKIKTLDVDGKKIKMQIWDTAGQERFKTITQTYYKGAMGIILAYAIDQLSSFQNIENWMKQIKQHASENVVVILVGNKVDLPPEKREVTYDQAKQVADQYGVQFFETSAYNGQNIHQTFFAMAKEIKSRVLDINNQKPTTNGGGGINLGGNNPKDQKDGNKGCC